MPPLRRPYTSPRDHDRHGVWAVALVSVVALVAAGAIGWAIGRGSASGPTRPVTAIVTTTAAPPTVSEHTARGAVAAAEANLVAAETSCVGGGPCQTRSAYSLGPDGGGLWSLAYRITSYSPRAAVIRAWQLGIAAGGSGPSQLAWQLADVPVAWTGSRWKQTGQVSTNPSGPAPPPSGSTGASSESFARTIAPFWRFPGAP